MVFLPDLVMNILDMHFPIGSYFTWTVNYEFVLLYGKHKFNFPNHSDSMKLTLTNTHTPNLNTALR